MKSAFDDEDGYELTQLGQQFVHYAMIDLPLKLNYQPAAEAQQTPMPPTPETAQASTLSATPA